MIHNIVIVSLSSGILGEPFMKHEIELGLARLSGYGLSVTFSEHALKGLDYIKQHPEKRAEDLIAAFQDGSVDMILCAIGGDDTYRLLPYLFEQDHLKNAAKSKVFLGFSDSTMNHFMLHMLGIATFYGQAFLPDICELSRDILPYTENYFHELITTGRISKVTPSPVWYDARTDFSESQVGVDMAQHTNQGFQLLQGSPVFEGKILGGCIDTIFDMFHSERYENSALLCQKYDLFPTKADWAGRILLLETSEEQMAPERFRTALLELKKRGVFEVINGILLGKPQNEVHMEAYHRILVETVNDPDLPILANLNIGHATPRCIIPFGVQATVNALTQEITFDYCAEKNLDI